MNIKDIINEELKKDSIQSLNEATVTAKDTKFNLRTGVNKNPTKLGVKIQFEPKSRFLEPDIKSQLEVALQEKLNLALSEYNIQVSKDTDVPREQVIGFFIPLTQVKNLIVKALGGKTEEPGVQAPPPEGPVPMNELSEKMIEEQILKEAMRVRDLNEISKVVYKEDFYGFINAGQNIMRTLEDHQMMNGKKYLEHLVKNNIL
tara:strand:+ start:605 stop:1213 length:609 start_codon:yes stop_codon:yes gene_type:complete